MKCPKYNKEMVVHRKDISKDESGKLYDRVIYICKEDDVWANVEIPKVPSEK